MKTIVTLEQIAALVEEREIIDHGSIRCLYSEEACESIEQVDSDEVGVSTIGSYALAAAIRSLDGEEEALLRLAVEAAPDYMGAEIADYIDPSREDEISALEDFVATVSDMVSHVDRIDEDDMAGLAGRGGSYGLTVMAKTEESWDEYDDGAVCSTTTTVTLTAGDITLTGEIMGYYSTVCACGDRFGDWQDADGPECDRHAKVIAALMGDDPAKYIDAPDEPDAPLEDANGEFVVLFHGWESPWEIIGRYWDDGDAILAMRIHQRKVRNANPGATYGWEHSTGTVVEDGDEQQGAELIDGLWVVIDDCDA